MLIALLAACTSAEDSTAAKDTAEDVLDVTVTEADYGELADDQFVWEGPVTTIDPGQDVMWCQFATYTGDDIGLHDIHTYQGQNGHHMLLMGTSASTIDYPDGAMVECSGEFGGFQMADLEPLGLPNETTRAGVDEVSMPLPDGMAVKLHTGDRYVLQSHYLNTTQQTLLIGDKAVITAIPADDVAEDHWVAPLIFNRDDFLIPAGEAASSSFDCTIDEDWNVLYWTGHMHEWGTAIRIGIAGEDPFYSIPEWDPVYRDAPPYNDYSSAPFAVAAGTTFTTTCDWFNDTDEDLAYPNEMCDSIAMVYPQKTATICDGDGQ